MSKFKVGDRVKCTNNDGVFSQRVSIKGKIGSVIGFGLGEQPCIEFDEYIGGHDGNGMRKGRAGHCWYIFDGHLKTIDERKILITTDGVTTLARMYEGDKVVKKAEAKCSPDDKFDFSAGANLAYDRLMRPDRLVKAVTEPTLEPIKLYCVKSAYHHITQGKVYELHGDLDRGSITFDNGWTDYGFSYRNGYWNCAGKAAKFLVPLVKRPAKVGEWVYITNGVDGLYETGEVKQVIQKENKGTAWLKGNSAYPSGLHIFDHRYLVLDGYAPEPEGWSGKAVSTTDDIGFTRGAVYEFENGVCKDNDGYLRPEDGERRIKDTDDNWFKVKFIKFMGEARISK